MRRHERGLKQYKVMHHSMNASPPAHASFLRRGRGRAMDYFPCPIYVKATCYRSRVAGVMSRGSVRSWRPAAHVCASFSRRRGGRGGYGKYTVEVLGLRPRDPSELHTYCRQLGSTLTSECLCFGTSTSPDDTMLQLPLLARRTRADLRRGVTHWHSAGYLHEFRTTGISSHERYQAM